MSVSSQINSRPRGPARKTLGPPIFNPSKGERLRGRVVESGWTQRAGFRLRAFVLETESGPVEVAGTTAGVLDAMDAAFGEDGFPRNGERLTVARRGVSREYSTASDAVEIKREGSAQ